MSSLRCCTDASAAEPTLKRTLSFHAGSRPQPLAGGPEGKSCGSRGQSLTSRKQWQCDIKRDTRNSPQCCQRVGHAVLHAPRAATHEACPDCIRSNVQPPHAPGSARLPMGAAIAQLGSDCTPPPLWRNLGINLRLGPRYVATRVADAGMQFNFGTLRMTDSCINATGQLRTLNNNKARPVNDVHGILAGEARYA